MCDRKLVFMMTHLIVTALSAEAGIARSTTSSCAQREASITLARLNVALNGSRHMREQHLLAGNQLNEQGRPIARLLLLRYYMFRMSAGRP